MLEDYHGEMFTVNFIKNIIAVRKSDIREYENQINILKNKIVDANIEIGELVLGRNSLQFNEHYKINYFSKFDQEMVEYIKFLINKHGLRIVLREVN